MYVPAYAVLFCKVSFLFDMILYCKDIKYFVCYTDRYVKKYRKWPYFVLMSVPRTDTQFFSDIAQRLKSLRSERNLSQIRVTMDTGVNVSRAESGKRSLSVYSVAVLCKYYGIGMDEFFRGIDLQTTPWE